MRECAGVLHRAPQDQAEHQQHGGHAERDQRLLRHRAGHQRHEPEERQRRLLIRAETAFATLDDEEPPYEPPIRIQGTSLALV